MTDEKLKQAKALQNDISEMKRNLEMARDNVRPCQWNKSYNSISSIIVGAEIRTILQAIVVSHLETELAKLEKQYEEL